MCWYYVSACFFTWYSDFATFSIGGCRWSLSPFANPGTYSKPRCFEWQWLHCSLVEASGGPTRPNCICLFQTITSQFLLLTTFGSALADLPDARGAKGHLLAGAKNGMCDTKVHDDEPTALPRLVGAATWLVDWHYMTLMWRLAFNVSHPGMRMPAWVLVASPTPSVWGMMWRHHSSQRAFGNV